MLNPFIKFGRKSESIRNDVRVNYKGYMFDDDKEHYLAIEIQQVFKIWFIRLWKTVSFKMFRIPFNLMQVIIDLSAQDLYTLDWTKVRETYRIQTEEHFLSRLKNLAESSINMEEQVKISSIIRKEQAKYMSMWEEWTSTEKNRMVFWTNDGYQRFATLKEGVSTYYYLIKILPEGVILVCLDTVLIGGYITLSNVDQMVVTKEFAQMVSAYIFKDGKGI